MSLDDLPPGLRILLIEDEPVIAMTAEDMIDALGGVVTAQPASVEDALTHVARGDFDLALLDINLNGVMSQPVAHALRKAEKPFVFTTGYGHCNFGEEFASVPVVSKPYTLASLSSAIRDSSVRPIGQTEPHGATGAIPAQRRRMT